MLREAENEAHLYRGLAKALDTIDEVIALIRGSQDADEARSGPDGSAGDRPRTRRRRSW